MKTAFLTGANVGQSNLLAKALAERGWRVFAGVLPGAPTDLTTGGNLTVIDQDVSDPESVKKSAAEVTAALEGKGLDLLMNIAGVANIAPGVIEAADFGEVEKMFQINTFGQLRVVQAFLPLVRKNAPGSRIANYTSGAMIVNPVGAGIYNMTKHAVHGMTLTLRNELAKFGIQVTSITPGGVLTGMSADSHKSTQYSWNRQPEHIRKEYEHLADTYMKVMPDMLEKTGSTPEECLERTLKILDKKKWRPVELLGKDVDPAMAIMRRMCSDSVLESIMRGQFKVPGYKG